jgi:predicted neuraminidase
MVLGICQLFLFPQSPARGDGAGARSYVADPLSPPVVIPVSDADYPGLASRQRQAAPSLAVMPEGRLWATWYAGPSGGEDENNYVVLATSGDGGASWDEVLVVDPDGPGPLRAFDPQVWVDPGGTLWFFVAIADDGVVEAHDGTTVELKGKDNAQTWAIIAEDGNDAATTWAAPRHIAPGVMLGKPTVLKNGEWLLPISDWLARVNKDPEAKSAGVYVSDDGGESFKLRGAALVPVEARNFDEHMIVERLDRSLWMLVRTHPQFSDSIGECVSTDGGATWSEVRPSHIKQSPARFFITRLQSGSLLLVKHGYIDERLRRPPHERRDLRAFISDDDGKTWIGGLMLDEREQVSYPDGQQAEDGTIYITYDHMRRRDRAIRMAVFTEEDVRAGELVSGSSRLAMTISQPEDAPAPKSVELAEGPSAVMLPKGGGTVETLLEGVKIWSNRNYIFSQIPQELEGMQFIQSRIETSSAEAVVAGQVYVIARDRTVGRRLLATGFDRVDIPSFIPFAVAGDYKVGDTSSVYQKKVLTGELVEYGNWGITVFAASKE